MATAIRFAIADPNLFQALPFGTVLMNREPRSSHKVDAFQSQTNPEVIEPDTFDCPTGDQWLEVLFFHVENMSSVKRHARCRKPGANDAMFIYHANLDLRVIAVQLL